MAAVVVLLAALALAGCVADDPVAAPGEPRANPDRTYEPGTGFVQIWMNLPLGVKERPLKEMWGVPRFVAFHAADNDTREDLDSVGYTDIAVGWKDWDPDAHGPRDYPSSAKRDWLEPSAVWYEGFVPEGNYSVIRIEMLDLGLTWHDGAEPRLATNGGRLSFTAEQDFVVLARHDTTIALQAKLSNEESGGFVVR